MKTIEQAVICEPARVVASPRKAVLVVDDTEDIVDLVVVVLRMSRTLHRRMLRLAVTSEKATDYMY